MISDEERRKAVRFLRERKCLELDCHECHQMSEAVFGDQHALCAIDGQWGALAELIDRPTCTVESVIYRDGWEEYDVRLSCGHEVTTISGAEDLAFCPNCGAEVVGDE